jgi:hypothetical protein
MQNANIKMQNDNLKCKMSYMSWRRVRFAFCINLFKRPQLSARGSLVAAETFSNSNADAVFH